MLTEMSTAPIAGVREPAAKRKGGSPEDARQGKMMMNQKAKVTSEVKVVTPDYARHLRDTAHFERQRSIRPENVRRLADEMAAGWFTQGTQIYICILPDGGQVVVNGNHTLEAICASGIPQAMTITKKQVSDINEAGRIYAVFDIQKVRSWRDSLRAVGADDTIPLAPRVLSAIGVIDEKFGQDPSGASRSRQGRINKMEDYRAAVDLLMECLAKAPHDSAQAVKRAPIMAVALETLRYQPSLGFEFWQRMAQDDGLTAGMPEKALLGWIRKRRLATGTGRREHCRAAALAWNRAFQGKECDYVKPNQMASFYLLGTPWANGMED